MIGIIIDMLSVGELYGLTDEIEIAKGRHNLTLTFKGIYRQKKREKEWRKR